MEHTIMTGGWGCLRNGAGADDARGIVDPDASQCMRPEDMGFWTQFVIFALGVALMFVIE